MGYRAELEAVRARADALAHELLERERELEALRKSDPSHTPGERERALFTELESTRRELASAKVPHEHRRTADPDGVRQTVVFAIAIAAVVLAAALFARRLALAPSHARRPSTPHVAHVAADSVDPADVSCNVTP